MVSALLRLDPHQAGKRRDLNANAFALLGIVEAESLIAHVAVGQASVRLTRGKSLTVACLTLLIAAVIGVARSEGRGSAPARSEPPGLSVSDLISLVRFGSRHVGAEGDDDSVYAPDGRHLVFVTQRGILRDNVREFSLWLLALRPRGAPKLLTSFQTSSNRAGIYEVSWQSSHAVTFLAEQRDGVSQAYSLHIGGGAPIPLTHSELPVVSFAISDDHTTTVYVTEDPPADATRFAKLRAHGFVIPSALSLQDAMLGKWTKVAAAGLPTNSIHVQKNGTESTVPLPDAGEFGDFFEGSTGAFIVSPRGTYALLLSRPRKPPKSWIAYTNDYLVKTIARGGSFLWWLVVDLRTGEVRPLTGGPTLTPEILPIWTDDEHVLLVDQLLPLDALNGSELDARASAPITAELDVLSRQTVILAAKAHLEFKEWNRDTKTLTVAPKEPNGSAFDHGDQKLGALISFHKSARGWSTVAAGRDRAGPTVEIIEDLNQPWEMRWRYPGMKATAKPAILDPNQQLLSHRQLARETEIHWTAPSGAGLSAGLYWPLDYEVGKRYPILIQTHDFIPGKFQPDGFATTGYAAQPLAAAGLFVAQVPRCENNCDSPKRNNWKEGERIVENFDSLIDHLSREGLIDAKLVGMHGYSRSCYDQLFYLTHGAHALAAMSCADGVDMSYVQYIAFGPSADAYARDVEFQNGGKPWGSGFASWLERAPGLMLDRVHTPVRLIAMSDPLGLLEEWEPFAGLTLLSKPVELLYLPDTVHNIVKPWERFASQQGTVDWFRFWLQGYERTEPVVDAEETSEQLSEQYARWHKLSALRDADVARRAE
jgi:hypothetical protein